VAVPDATIKTASATTAAVKREDRSIRGELRGALAS
jgi:hypothetical protein